jgi:hypothetical protein
LTRIRSPKHIRLKPTYTHVAFSVAPVEFDAMRRRILASGAPVWQDNATEGDSLYFIDPNGHKLEIRASDLHARLRAARSKPCEGLQIFDMGNKDASQLAPRRVSLNAVPAAGVKSAPS